MTIKMARIGRANISFDMDSGSIRVNNVGYDNHWISITDSPVFSYYEDRDLDSPIIYTFSVSGRRSINITGSSDTNRPRENPEEVSRIVNENLGAMFRASIR